MRLVQEGTGPPHLYQYTKQLLGDCMPFLTYVFPKGTSTTAFAMLKWNNFGLCPIDIFAHEICHLASSAHMRELNSKVCWVSCRIIISFWKFHFYKLNVPKFVPKDASFSFTKKNFFEKNFFLKIFSMSKNNIIYVELAIELGLYRRTIWTFRVQSCFVQGFVIARSCCGPHGDTHFYHPQHQ